MSTNLASNLLKRNASADILKAISIFAVVFIHGSSIIPVVSSKFDVSEAAMLFFKHAFRFCVPIFIFLWAYFAEKSVVKSGKDTSWKRLYKLFIPFLFWSLVYFLYTANFKNLTLTSAVTKHWVGYGWSGQYYFIILFQLIALFGIIRIISKYLLRYVPATIIVSLLFYGFISYSNWFGIGVLGKLSYRQFIYWLPYVILGIVYAKKNSFKLALPMAFALLSPILILAEIYLLHPPLVNEYMLPSVFLTTLILISSMETKLTYEYLTPWFANLIQVIANSTLGIFCLNPLIILILSPLLRSLAISINAPGIIIIMSIVSTMLIMAICILIIKLLKKFQLNVLVSN